MPKKKITLCILLVLSLTAAAQNRASYDKAIKEANTFLDNNDYLSALTKFHAAGIAAQENHLDSRLADAGADKAARLIRSEHDAYTAYKREKDNTDNQLRQIAVQVSKLNDLVQDNTNATLKAKLLNAIIPLQNLTVNNFDLNDRAAIISAQLTLGETSQDVGNTGTATTTFAQAYQQSRKMIDGLKSKGKVIPASLSAVYARAAASYSTVLTDRGGLPAAGGLITEARLYLRNCSFNLPECEDGLARLEMAAARYEEELNHPAKELFYSKQAIARESAAINLAPGETRYKNGLAAVLIRLGNLKALADSAGYYGLLACRTLNEFKTAAREGNELLNRTGCARIQVRELLKMGHFDEAQDTLRNAVKSVSEFIKYSPGQPRFSLLRASLYIEMARIYHSGIPDRQQEMVCRKFAAADFIATFKGKKALPSESYLLKQTFNGIMDGLPLVPESDRLSFVAELTRAVEPTAQEYPGSTRMAYIMAILNFHNGTILAASKTRQDSLLAAGCFGKSAGYFNNARILERDNGYSEDYAIACAAYSQRLIMTIKNENKARADSAYNAIVKRFMPLYAKYDYDADLGWWLASASRSYGTYLYRKGAYRTAVEPLAFASNEGLKSGTDYLVKIYSANGRKDADKLKLYQQRAAYQHSDDRKEFSIDVLQDGRTEKMQIYVLDKAIGHKYKGIDDQVIRAYRARHITVDTTYVNQFSRYQDLAWKSRQSFQVLSDQAFDEANTSINFLNKYMKYKNAINAERNLAKKKERCYALYKIYEADLAKESVRIKNDAVAFYLDYASLLQSGHDLQAKALYERVLELDPQNTRADSCLTVIYFEQNAGNIVKSDYANTPEHLKLFLKMFLKDGDNKRADIVASKLIAAGDEPKVRDEINEIYNHNGGYDHFYALFLSNKKKIREYLDYFLAKNATLAGTDDEKRNYYNQVIILYEEYERQRPKKDPALFKSLSECYNAYVWYGFLTNKKESARYYLNRSMEFDPSNNSAVANQANALLLDNDYDRAKTMYLELKDRNFDDDGHTFRVVFLDNLRTFREKGIKNKYIKLIVDMLNK